MDKQEIYERVLKYNNNSYTFAVRKDGLIALNFKYALIDGIITEDEYEFYFRKK